MKRILIVAWILAGVGSSLATGEEPKKIVTRRYDLSAVVNPARDHPLVLRPQGNLIFRSNSDYERARWDGIPSFGGEWHPAARGPEARIKRFSGSFH